MSKPTTHLRRAGKDANPTVRIDFHKASKRCDGVVVKLCIGVDEGNIPHA